jgi:Domain of unknown function (DUF4126)
MHILEQLGVALGLATLAGVNLYLTVLITGLALRFDLLNLAAQYQQLEVLGHPVVLIVAGVLFCLEFFADKVPWVDSMWDSVHTFIRPVGGVLLGLTALGDMPVYVQVVAALVAGGAALTTHGAKAGTRLLINHSPEPVTNITMSVTEDVAVVGGTALTLLNPVLGLVVFASILLILWMLFPRIWRGIRATTWLMWNKLKMPGKRQPITEPVNLKCVVSEDLRNLLKSQAGVEESEVVATVRCLSGKSRAVRGLSPNLEGLLILTTRNDKVYFAASKGLSDRVFRLPLGGSTVRVESKFLSENLLLDMGGGGRAVLRFPRGQSALAETVFLHLNEMIAMTRASQPEFSEEEPSMVPTVEAVEPVSSFGRTTEDEPVKQAILPIPAIG